MGSKCPDKTYWFQNKIIDLLIGLKIKNNVFVIKHFVNLQKLFISNVDKYKELKPEPMGHIAHKIK